MTEFLNLASVLIFAGFAAFCWRTYRTTDDTTVRAFSYTLAILAALGAFYVALIRHVFSNCLCVWCLGAM